MPFWRQLDRAGLDAQFALDIPGLDAIFARRIGAARSARAALWHRARVAYGDGPAETLDIFPAFERRDPPVLIFIHGGFWRSLDAALFSFVGTGFVPQGAAVVVIDYPLIPDVRMGDIVASCRKAVAWVHRNARSFGASPDRLYISGNSAGGHLVASLAERGWLDAHDLPADAIKGACAISGLFELTPVRLSSQDDTLHLTEDEVARHSPLRHIPRAAAPTLFAVGGDETPEFLLQNREAAAAWTSAGLRSEVMEVPGANHITVVLDAFARPGHPLNAAVCRMMGLP